MTTLDWMLLVIGGGSAIWGLWRGLVREVLSLAGWVLSFWLGQRYASQAGLWLPLNEGNEALRQLAGFVLVFLLVLVSSAILANLLKSLSIDIDAAAAQQHFPVAVFL